MFLRSKWDYLSRTVLIDRQEFWVRYPNRPMKRVGESRKPTKSYKKAKNKQQKLSRKKNRS